MNNVLQEFAINFFTKYFAQNVFRSKFYRKYLRIL